MAKAVENHSLGVDPGKIGGALAVADSVHRAAKVVRLRRKTAPTPTTAQTMQRIGQAESQIAGRQRPHRRRRQILRGKAAGMHHHQPLRDGVDRERDDHRGNAEVGDAEAIHEPEPDAAGDAEGNGERLARGAPTGRRRRHHAADRDDPGHREVDLAEQDDDHRARRDDAEKRGDLQLLQQILRREEAARIDRPDEQERDDAGEGDRDRAVDLFEQARRQAWVPR